MNLTSLNIYLLKSKNKNHKNDGKWDNTHLVLHLCEVIARNVKMPDTMPVSDRTNQLPFLPPNTFVLSFSS